MHLQKKLKIFYSPVETRRKRSDVGISTNLSNLFFLPLQKKKKIQVYLDRPQRKPYIAKLVFRMLKKGIFE